MPWEERVKLLPRYEPLPGYEPGVRRIKPVYADPLTVDPRSSRELSETYSPPSKWTHKGGHPGPERGMGSGRGYNVRYHPWKAVGTPKGKVRPRIVDPVSGCRKSHGKVRRA